MPTLEVSTLEVVVVTPTGVHFLFASVTGGVNNSSTFSTGLLSFGFIPNCSTCFDGSLAIALL